MRHLAPLAPLSLALLLTACGDGKPLLPADAVLPDGGRYRGEIVEGRLQGQGRLDYEDGNYFKGNFKDGLYHGKGEWHRNSGETYIGEFQAGVPHGLGLITYSDGTTYEGNFVKGHPEGEGYLKSKYSEYRGEFKKGRFHGLGKQQWKNGESFQGQFKNDEPQGQGILTDAMGNQFIGTFKSARLNGLGSFKGKDGALYSGEFRDNQFHGKGRYQSADGQVWNGQFRNGNFTGQGEYKGAEGEHYLGSFLNWRYHGEGKLTQTDGSQYEGHFRHGRFAGQGTLRLADGSTKSGVWLRGQRIKDEHGKNLPDSLASGILEQGRLLNEAIERLPASTPAIELYGLTLAGDGKQSVFMREADYVAKLLQERFAARGLISLTNHRDQITERPLATSVTLGRSLQALAKRSGPEDIIFIYLTSHGSAEHELNLDQPRLQLHDLPATELAELLQPLKDRYKVLVISACYSGGFIPAVQDEKTLVMTAARADRVSFGCSEENDFTYFGRALFGEALHETDDLQRAFELAKSRVAEREQADGYEASEPQLWLAKPVLAQWQKLRSQQAGKALGEPAQTSQ